jgi:hypothetical protein
MEQKLFSKYGKLIHLRITEDAYKKLGRHAVDTDTKVNKLILKAIYDLVETLDKAEIDWENPEQP